MIAFAAQLLVDPLGPPARWEGFGSSGTSSAVGGAVLLVLVCVGAVSRQLLQPLWSLVRSMDQALEGGGGIKLDQQKSPVARALGRRFQDANSTLQERERMSQAELLSVEIAFDRIHAVVQSLTEGVIVVDGDGNVVLSNKSARGVLKDDERQIVGRPLVEFLHGELRDAVEGGLRQVDAGVTPEARVMNLESGDRVYDLANELRH